MVRGGWTGAGGWVGRAFGRVIARGVVRATVLGGGGGGLDATGFEGTVGVLADKTGLGEA